MIKDVDKWDTAKTKDFMQTSSSNVEAAAQRPESELNNNTLTINEEVKTIEYAPAVF